MDIIATIQNEFKLTRTKAESIISLLDEGLTVPFIARYRKEMTGGADDELLRDLDERLTYLKKLKKRKEEVYEAVSKQGKMTDVIAAAIENSANLTEIEDVYRPFKQKRKTRAQAAEEKGLRPIADAILGQCATRAELDALCSSLVNEEKGVKTASEALYGGMDIVAEVVSDCAELRKRLRFLTMKNGFVVSSYTKKSEELRVGYEQYGDFAEEVSRIPSHRILAINRGEDEGVLSVKIVLNKNLALAVCNGYFVLGESEMKPLLVEAIEDSFDRLIFPSVEREARFELTSRSNHQAIRAFETNLRQLLMQPPIRNKTVMGIDPAYRTGCKVAVVSPTMIPLEFAVIYPTPPHSKIAEAEQKLTELIRRHRVDIIAIGNGTAGRETERFVADLIKKLPQKVEYAIVNEAGASVYSASKLGAEEYPDLDVTQRSAISIACRLIDPLAELIKIDPKSIGVGQYQHDMPESELDGALDGVLESCVSGVGVDINTASVSLLSHVAGLNSKSAKNIVAYREKKGAFVSRAELLQVNGMGDKTYEQSVGFIRVPNSENVLDNTAVHPESYGVAMKLLSKYGYGASDIGSDGIAKLPERVACDGEEAVADALGCGRETLVDIISELLRPGRDVRDSLPKPRLRRDVMTMEDLREGMILAGVVRNVVDFGAFIDIGVHQDGLVHISRMTSNYIRNPSDLLKVGEEVSVRVLDVDTAKKRISLSLLDEEGKRLKKDAADPYNGYAEYVST